MRILITGGAGYIGSHTLLEVLGLGHEACVIDNFSNSRPEALDRVKRLAGAGFEFEKGDIRDGGALAAIFSRFRPDAVIHFAGLKAVGESAVRPLDYYDHNVAGALSLLKTMQDFDCHRIVFSSSATVYGEPHYLPCDESHPLAPANVYGRTKLMIETMLRDWCASTAHASAVMLRYFNPAGAHESGLIGEAPSDIPNNLMPFITQVAVGRRERLSVFGDDYDTRDGTGLRDYVHVCDLACAHVAALDYATRNTGAEAVNIGTGGGVTVLEMIAAFETASGRPIPYSVAPRRAGDIAALVADPRKAASLLGWEARRSVEDMCQSAWNWQSRNPGGYDGPAG